MKQNKNKDKYPPLLGFIDLLLNAAVMFCFLFILSQLLINVNKSQVSSAEREGVYIITATWNLGVDADVDLWAKAPNDERSGFFSRDVQTMSLLRDDLGNSNDKYINENGQEVVNPTNREEVTIRTPMPGQYVINLHYFRAPREPNPEPITVVVTLKKIKENITLAEQTIVLKNAGEEQTALVFRLNTQKELVSVEKPDKPILWVVNGAAGIGMP